MDALTETRSLAFEEAEIRAEGRGARQRFVFHGYAATFGTRSHELREHGINRGRPFVEVVKPGAASETIANDDVRFVLNHDLRQLLGRTGSGTLRLAEDERGIDVEGDLPNTSYARDYAELVERGDAGEMSFRFYQPRETWATDPSGIAVRSLESFRLREVSALTVPPAYPETEAGIAIAARALAEAQEELRAGRTLSQANVDALEALIGDIQSILDKAEGKAEGSAGDAPDGDRALPIDLLRRRLALRSRGI